MMQALALHNDCTGCTACYAACARGAIAMKPDAEGFLHPVIDESKCVNCGLCAKVCPVLLESPSRTPLIVYAAKAKDDELRMKSSSGGVFSLLARQVISEGGIVFGAGFDHDDWHVMHKSAENEEELDDLRGSKYVQSEMGDVFRRVKTELEKKRKVLFSGTPCQVAGLISFLGKEYENLVTQEVICNSVPSPKVFLAWTQSERKGVPDEELKKIFFRDKENGWHNTTLKYCFTTTTTTSLQKSTYYKLWQRGFSVRRSCIHCAFRSFKSGADLTIGDFWGIENVNPLLDDNKGISLVLNNTEKGLNMWNTISSHIDGVMVELVEAVKGNPCLYKSYPCLNEAADVRDFFWRKINSGADLKQLGYIMTKEHIILRIRRTIGRVLRKMGARK